MTKLERAATLLFPCVLAVSSVSRAAPDTFTVEALSSGLRWRSIGPFRAGRTVAATGVPGKPNLFYVAACNGGIFRSDDAGRTWEPIFDEQPTGSIGALAVAPSDPNVLYVGSGEGLQRPDLSVGDGMYRSTDAGKTWRHLGLRDAQQIPAVAVDPADAKRLYVAALGHPYGPNAERGIFRSTDAGETFEKVLYRDENTGAAAIALDPADPRTLYAVLWEARQGPWENAAFSGPGSGLHRSTDGGATWRGIGKGLPTFAEGRLGRIGIGIAPRDGRRVYALVEADAKHGGLYRSTDAGESFEKVNDDIRLWGRGNDFAELKVDPRDPDVVWVANIALYRSTDAGKTFTCVKGAPGGDDYHTIWINPDDPQVILLATDQGATISVNGGRTWSSWYNQPTAQLYHVSTDDRFPYYVYGGQQESGSVCIASRGDHGAITFRDWLPVGVEEYGYVAPDPVNPDIVYGGKLSRFDFVSGQTQNVSPEPVRRGAYRFLRTAPVLFSPVDPKVLYLAGNVLFRTTSGGRSWEVISPDLSRETPEVTPSVGVYATPEVRRVSRRGVIYALAPSPLDGALIWAGTDDGLIHVTRDGGKTWTNVTPPSLSSWSKVSQLDASRFDKGVVYAAINRLRCDDLAPHVLVTRDSGATWSEITQGLPADEPVNAVREDPVRRGLLYAATEKAVHVSLDDGASWQSLRRNMPATSVRDLVVKGADLVVGTHGRGFWILDDVTPLRQAAAARAADGPFLFAPQAATRVRRNLNTDTPLPPEEPAGENPPDGAILDFWLPAGATGPVTLEVLDAAGKVVRRYSSDDKPAPPDLSQPVAPYWMATSAPLPATAGVNRFVWDLRHTSPDALEREYPISAIPGRTPLEPQGPYVLPGRYRVRLTATLGGSARVHEQPLEIRMDPRVAATLEDLLRQHELSLGICEAISRDAAAIARVKELRRSAPKKDEKREAALAALEGVRRPRRGGPAPAPSPDLTRLNGQLVTLLGVVQGADAAPTTQAEAAFATISKDLDGLLATLADVEKPPRKR